MIWALFLQVWSYSWGASGPSWAQYGAELRKSGALQSPRAYVMRLNGATRADLPYDSFNPRATGWGDSLISPCFDTRGYAAVYVRFAYQRGGYSDPPESDDTLRLWGLGQDGMWHALWEGVGTGQADTAFTGVVLVLTDSLWQHTCFRLKWSVWGSLYGAYDNWLLAYTAIGSDSTADTPHFIQLPRLYWRPYGIRPAFSGFQAESLVTLLAGPSGLTVRLRQIVNGMSSSQVFTCTGNVDTVRWPPLPSQGNTHYDLIWQIERLSGEILESWADTTSLAPYYGYDDGEAEQGYGLAVADRPFMQVFALDTIAEVDRVAIRFFPVPTQVGKSFQLALWALEEQGWTPVYLRYHRIQLDSVAGGLVTYPLDTVLRLKGRVGVGFIQADNKPLGVGWDGDYEGEARVFRDSAGQWVPSRLKGCLMVRLGLGTSPLALPWGAPSESWRLQPVPVSGGGRLQIVGAWPGPLQVLDGLGRVWALWDTREVVAPALPGWYWVIDRMGRGQPLLVLP